MKFRNLLFLSLTIILMSCQKQHSQNHALLNPATFSNTIQKTDNPQIVDVRTPEEFEVEHLVNAKNINWKGDHFDPQVEKLDKTKPIFIYCRSGKRSQQAAAKLTELGFENIYELDGGMLQWNLERLKVSTK